MSAHSRPKGWLGVGLACFGCAATGRREHLPVGLHDPNPAVRRIDFEAGGGHGWRISALTTSRPRPAPWKIVVVTGAPSWAEYWEPVMAALPPEREMVVVDRPGYACSEPLHVVPDIGVQAEALAPLLDAPRGQKLLLVGQSYGAAIAALMADRRPDRVHGLVLLSGLFGELGPTAQRLVEFGSAALAVIPRDLRNAVQEVRGQAAQLERARRALQRLRAPVHAVHGDRDDFAPFEAAERLVAELAPRRRVRLHHVPGADHFINDGPAEDLLAALEACIPAPRPAWTWPDLSRLVPAWPRPAQQRPTHGLARG